MQHVSLICEIEIMIFVCCTPNVSAYSGIAAKLLMNGFAKLFVICKLTPNSIEKIKNSAISLRLKSAKALSPKASAKLFLRPSLMMGQAGSVKA